MADVRKTYVAPDHAETKLVTKKFHETLTTREDVAYYGNVGLGRDVSVGELMDGYHGVVLACGASGDRRLEVPGEETRRGVLSAREFVAWFNGDPAHGPESETHARVRDASSARGVRDASSAHACRAARDVTVAADRNSGWAEGLSWQCVNSGYGPAENAAMSPAG